MTTTTRTHQTTSLAIFKWRSLKTRVTTFTLALFLLGFWSLAFYSSFILHNDMEQTSGEQQFSTVSILAAGINNELSDRLRALENVAARITPTLLGNTVSIQTFLEDRPVLSMMFSAGVLICNIDGVAIADVPITMGRIGINYADRDFILEALKGKSSIGKPVMDKKMQTPVFAAAAPIRDIEGKVIGVLAGVTSLDAPNFLGKITDNSYGKTGGYVLVSPQIRTIVYATNKKRIMEVLPAPGVNPLIDRFIQGYEGSGVVVNPHGIEVLASAKAIPVSGWYIAALIPTEEAFAPVRVMQKRMLLATIFLTMLAGGLTWWMLKRQLAPVFTAMKELAVLSDADTNQPRQPLPITRQDEIGELIGGFNHLLKTLERREMEIHRLNAELEQRVTDRTAQLESANKELEAFCYSVSHDLRAPLRHIVGYVELLVSRFSDGLTDKGLHYINTIADSARQMGVLIDDLLRFSRTGRQEMRRESLNMSQALQEALLPLKESNFARRIEWVIADLPSVRGDYALIRQVWANLLGNAVKYTRPREVARIEISARKGNGEIIFVVKDNGVGFDMQYASNLFGVFQRLHSMEEFEGIGIGLATVQRIISRHGGRIWAEAELNQSAAFYFSLPI